MTIDPKKKYTVYSILKQGLLVSPRTGKPFKTQSGITNRLLQNGFHTEKTEARVQYTYLISGQSILELNKKATSTQ
jgi:hypothetical protein